MNKLPQHIAIIMDGNRRWAKTRGLPMTAGHSKGAKTLKRIVIKSVELNLKNLTVFAFSTENWDRLPSEIESIFKIIERYIKGEIAQLNANNIVFKVIGDKSKLNENLRKLVINAEDMTKRNDGLKLNVALNYGGKNDIVFACKNIASLVSQGKLDINSINESFFRKNLLSESIPDIDMLIRTSGEQRISNFLLWQLSYSEFVFSNVQWPDFTERELEKSIEEYGFRHRRFGASDVI